MTLRSTGLQSDSDLDLVMFTGSNNAVVYKIDEYQVLWTSPPSTHNIFDLYEENGIEWRWSFVSNKCVYCRRDCILVFPEQLLWGQLHYTKTNGRFFTIQNSWRFSHWQKGNGRFFTIIVQLLIYNWTLVCLNILFSIVKIQNWCQRAPPPLTSL